MHTSLHMLAIEESKL